MKCKKCGDDMELDKYPVTGHPELEESLWRCDKCGNIYDEVKEEE